MANSNANQNKGQGQQSQGSQQGQKGQSQQGQGQQSGGREINPNRPSGEPGKLPQNAGSALDAGNGGTATQGKSQSGGQSKSSDLKQGMSAKGNDARTGGSGAGGSEDQDSPTGIGRAVKEGEAESTDEGEDDLSPRGQHGRSDKPM